MDFPLKLPMNIFKIFVKITYITSDFYKNL